MVEIRKMTSADVEQCAKVYRSAYAAEPWKEEYTEEEVREYLSDFIKAESMRCYVLAENGKIIGLALTILVPSVGSPYLRIEDFCIGAEYHGKGFGSRLMELLAEEAGKMGCDSIILGTQRGFPSHRFYLKNGFKEIESVLLYRDIENERREAHAPDVPAP